MNENVTLFRDTYETHKPFFLPIDTALNRVKKGTYKAKVNQLRRYRQEDKNKYDEMKPTLPAFVFQGEFTNRSNEDIQKASGFFTADIDKLSGDLESLKQQIANDPSVYAAFISPSNVGIKALFRIPLVTDNDKYHFVFEQISQYTETTYHVKIDRACKDVARICYASYDPDLILHPDATEFHIDWAEYNRQKVQEESEKAARKVEQVKRAARLKAELKKNDAGLDKLDELCQKKLLYHQQWMVEKLSQASPSDPVQGRHQAYIACGILAKSMLDGYAADLTSLSELSDHVASIRTDFRPVDKSTFEKLAKDSTEADPITKADIWANYQEWKKDHPATPKTQGPPHPADVADVQHSTPQEPPPIEETTTRLDPSWRFWDYIPLRDQTIIKINPLKFLEFLTASQFRIFNKRGVPVVVEETEDSMNKTIVRGKVNTTVKTDVIESLLDAGFDDVAGFFIMNPKYFTIDTLESLPLIPEEKAQKSIFSEQETEITLATPFVKEDPLFSFDESPILSPGNTLAIVGRQGLGKSGVCELFISMALSQDCEPASPFESHPQGGLVLWIDTERTSNDMLTALHRIVNRTQAGTPENSHLLNNDKTSFTRLQVERCGGIEDKMTWLMEKLEVIQEPLDLVVIDGALDLVDSMNDEADAKHFFDDIQMITDKKQCGVILTIHSAPNDENGKGMGHIGSIIMRKCSSFLQIRNNAEDKSIKELSTDFTHAKMRHGKDWGVYAAIQWDEVDHMLHFVDYTPPEAQPRSEKMKEDACRVFDFIFQKEPRIKFTTLKERYAAKTGKTEKTARNHIKKAVEVWKFLSREGDIYTLCH